MSKKKTKLYQTTPPKDDSKTIHIKIDKSEVKGRNLMHLDAQIMFPALVTENKKRKRPKYPHKIYEEY